MGDVTWSGSKPEPIRRAIAALEKDTASHAGVLADLAAAYVAAAERSGSTLDVLHAVNAGDRAVEADPASTAARWNLAVALDMLTADGDALRAWDAYLAVDSTSPWATEARARRAVLRTIPNAPPPPPGPGAAAERLDAWVELTPQGAREHGWSALLPAWGAAVLKGDAAAAARSLHDARVLARALERRGLDASLAQAVAAIDAARRMQDRRRLATAHIRFGDGMRDYGAGNREDAFAPFGDAAAAGELSPALTLWARLFYGMCGVYASVPGADGEIAAVASAADSLRTPALWGRAQWAIATTASKQDRSAAALPAYQAAATAFARAREPELAATMRMMHAQAMYSGKQDAAFEHMQPGLEALRAYPWSGWRHTQLQALAQNASAAGLPLAALHVQNESLRTAELEGVLPHVVEGRTGLAEILLRLGRRTAAESVATRAVPAESPMDGSAVSYFRLQMLALWASIRMEDDPHGAIAALDSAIRGPAALRNADRLIPLYRQRARAWRKLGDAGHERADLDTVLRISERVRDATPALAARTAMADSVWSEVNRLVMLALAAGQPDSALRYLERGRESFSRLPSATRRGPFRVPAGEVALDYAMIGDTLLVWIVRGNHATVIRTIVNATELQTLIRETNEQMARGGTEAAIDTRLRHLHRLLIAPLLATLAPSDSTLVIVADGDIAATPFAALRDSASGRYLIEDRILRFAPTLPTTVSTTRERPPGRVLVVADPTVDQKANPGLPALPGARAEAADVVRLYPGASLLQGSSATSETFLRALRSTEIVHYAGHAVFDADRPAASHLALAPGVGEGYGRVTAAQLSRMHLDNVRLVVLSACRANPSKSGRSGGSAGLAGALLYAGAGGVVGSQWQVDDQRSRTVMQAFHVAYRQSGNAAWALRRAQLSMLRHAVPERGSAPVWAGFRLVMK